MPPLIQSRRIPRRVKRTLRVRGDAAHTFGTLLTPLAVALVALGFYLLGSAFSHPLTADSGVLLTASIVLALGFVLLSYLLRSAMTAASSPHSAPSRRNTAGNSPRERAGPTTTYTEEPAAPLSFHRVYVDSARIRR